MKWGPFFVEEIDNLTSELVVLSRFKVERSFVKKLTRRKARLSSIIAPYFAGGVFKLELPGVEEILNKVFKTEKTDYYADVLFDGTEHRVMAVGHKIDGDAFRWIPMGLHSFYLRDSRSAFHAGKLIEL
ncbi:hypothetical protein BNJ_00332 [Kaumoebavirus]|uniref:hypothetical protein n=1 Tax=Kaumoebavirus TaxID=1859492 RepID=UPI0009C38AEB|nr:hypothetical protein BNJ_00332 [Kaumoebavirus]ARA72152.1 hypothetical protein BNJ_00332 [Kaumoebavirus]